MKLKVDIEELMKKYEKMNEDQKAEFRRSYGLVQRSKAAKRRNISKEYFQNVFKEVLEITRQRIELISKWKELQKKLDPNPKDKKAQLKRILYAGFDANLSAVEKMRYHKRRGRGYRIFEYAKDHTNELGLGPFTEEDIELMNEAYMATLSFPKRHRLSKRDRMEGKTSNERTTNDSPAD
jgi:hypothetical protein